VISGSTISGFDAMLLQARRHRRERHFDEFDRLEIRAVFFKPEHRFQLRLILQPLVPMILR